MAKDKSEEEKEKRLAERLKKFRKEEGSSAPEPPKPAPMPDASSWLLPASSKPRTAADYALYFDPLTQRPRTMLKEEIRRRELLKAMGVV